MKDGATVRDLYKHLQAASEGEAEVTTEDLSQAALVIAGMATELTQAMMKVSILEAILEAFAEQAKGTGEPGSGSLH